MLAALLPALIPILGDALRRLFPDPAEAAKAQADLSLALLANANEIEKAAADIVRTEAQSGNWLASSWRPLVMLTFTTLIVMRWLGYAAPGLSEAEVLKLWDIVQLGLGGYVIGRTAEKIMPQIVQAVAGGVGARR